MINPSITVLPDAAGVAMEAAKRVVAQANSCVKAKGSFTIALSGGSTPKALYTLLASPEFSSQMPWDDTEFFFGDERCVPPDHKDSNFLMASQALFSKAPIPPENIHRMRGELPPEEAAAEYERLIENTLRPSGSNGLDLVLLGMGDDGHTASIFPGTVAVQETQKKVMGYFAENSSTGRSWRVTFTAPLINDSAVVMFLICGASKADRLTEVLEGPRDASRLPSQLIDPKHGRLELLIDSAAAGMNAAD